MAKTIYIAGLGLIGASMALGSSGIILIMRFWDTIAVRRLEISPWSEE